jgi:UDP-GlcNAc:undecaprenyl-phosphate GlcNAc-1-phosphate transferase
MLISSLFFNVLLVFFITLLCCFIGCLIAKRLNLLDSPDGLRKIHIGEIPLAGGFSLYLSILVVTLLLSDKVEILPDEFIVLFFVSFLVLLLGIFDDLKSLPISFRFIVQIVASWIVILLTDSYLKDLGDLFGMGNIYLGQLGIPITILMVVGVCNAFNMLDGMDGLVSLVSFTAICFLSVILFFNQSFFEIPLFISLSLLVFLLFNLGFMGKKWKMFLGGGSMWLGFLLAWSLVIFSQGDTSIISPVSAIWFIFLPLIDAFSTFLTRIRAKKAIYSGDRTHLHHLLLDSGFGDKKVMILFLTVSFLSCLFASFSILFEIEDYYLFYGFVTLWIFYYLLIKYPYSKKVY